MKLLFLFVQLLIDKGGYAHQYQSFVECTAAKLGGSFFREEGSFPGFGKAIAFASLQRDGICFVRVHSLSMSRSQDLALLPRCCSSCVDHPNLQLSLVSKVWWIMV